MSAENTIQLTQDLEHMLICAVRYALGRRTYIVGTTAAYIGGLLPKLSNWCIGVIWDDLESEYALAARVTSYYVLGDPYDLWDWVGFKAAIHAEIERRSKEKRCFPCKPTPPECGSCEWAKGDSGWLE